MESPRHNNIVKCEPMDIDTSINSIKDMDISFNDSEDVIYVQTTLKCDESTTAPERLSSLSNGQPVIKKFHINIQKPSKSRKRVVLKMLSAILIAFASVITYHMYTLKCCDDIDIENLSKTLTHSVYGQTEAINVIIDTLNSTEPSKILFFTGGTGVGKTYVSSIILKSLGTCSNSYHYVMPTFVDSFSTEYMVGLTLCKRALLIVDDLSINDMHINNQINQVIEKSKYLEKDILVILIYNCYHSKGFSKNCAKSFYSHLLHNFENVKALKRIVKFETLSEIHLRRCIMNELGDRILDDTRLSEILKTFNVTNDGCKAVHSKMKYFV